ncbi:MAG: Sec-independent protein translocase subunit TatA [Actinomycetota bacterium]|jgi:sec-independent protein translocase protein TatA|nr:Sec-independent protein translocase subunit TatA [Actinomycetota bacterium]
MGSLGPTELLLILLVLVLLFGARKLPDLARGTGRALRIFKSETKGLVDDDEDESDDRRTADNTRSQITTSRSQPDAADPSAPRQTQTSDALPPTHTEK